MLNDFINSVGRNALLSTCNVTARTLDIWRNKGAIPRKYHPLVEKLARDKGCFTMWKRLAGGKKQ